MCERKNYNTALKPQKYENETQVPHTNNNVKRANFSAKLFLTLSEWDKQLPDRKQITLFL